MYVLFHLLDRLNLKIRKFCSENAMAYSGNVSHTILILFSLAYINIMIFILFYSYISSKVRSLSILGCPNIKTINKDYMNIKYQNLNVNNIMSQKFNKLMCNDSHSTFRSV